MLAIVSWDFLIAHACAKARLLAASTSGLPLPAQNFRPISLLLCYTYILAGQALSLLAICVPALRCLLNRYRPI